MCYSGSSVWKVCSCYHNRHTGAEEGSVCQRVWSTEDLLYQCSKCQCQQLSHWKFCLMLSIYLFIYLILLQAKKRARWMEIIQAYLDQSQEDQVDWLLMLRSFSRWCGWDKPLRTAVVFNVKTCVCLCVNK